MPAAVAHDDGSGLGRPFDGEVRVEWVDRQELLGTVQLAEQVGDDGVVREGEGGVPDAGRHVQRGTSFGIEVFQMPGTECGRSGAQVHQSVEDRAAGAGDVLGVVGDGDADAAKRAEAGDDGVGLSQAERLAGGDAEHVVPEELLEFTADIVSGDRVEGERPGNREWAALHRWPSSVSRPGALRRTERC